MRPIIGFLGLLGHFRGIGNAEEIRDAGLTRLRKHKDSELGDPDQAHLARSPSRREVRPPAQPTKPPLPCSRRQRPRGPPGRCRAPSLDRQLLHRHPRESGDPSGSLARLRLPLDNNPTQRTLRGIVVGRKNHYGSRSRRGCQVTALFYTLSETAKLRGIESRAYLLLATATALKEPGAVTYP